MTKRSWVMTPALLCAVAACGTVHPTANELLSDPAAKLRAPGSTVTRTYASNGHKSLTSSDRSSIALAETSTSTPEVISAFYDQGLLAMGWARDCRAVLSLSTDGPSTGYGWSKGTRQLSLTVFSAPVEPSSFKVEIRVAASASRAVAPTGGPLRPC